MADLARKSKEEIFELIKRTAEKLYPDADWSGLRTGSFEWLMAQVVAEVSALNGQYVDLRANNAYISTANVRKDVRDIAQNLGLVPTERAGATVNLSLTSTDTVTVPKGTRVVSTNGVSFATLTEVVMTGATTASVQAVHGDYEQITYRARGDSGEVVKLNRDDVLIANLTVEVDGDEWERVDNLFGQTHDSKVYRVVFDERNRASIKFGDGVYGDRVAADAEVVIDLYTGGGPDGNAVGAATLTAFLDSFTNSSNVSTITNAAAPSGGVAADSLDDITASIPGQLRQIAGLINKEDVAAVVKSNLSWVADATAETGHTFTNEIYVPTVKICAYPHASAVQDMSSAQSSELSTFLADRGELGAVFSAQDAYAAPVEIEVDVRLQNKNLETQKEAEIKAALRTDTGAPFYFDNLGFNKEYKLQDILSTIEDVGGVKWARMRKFAKKPHGLVTAGFDASVNGFADLELGTNAEDGYFEFRASASTTADVSFFRPVKVDKVGSNYIKSSEANWLKEEYSYTGADLDDTDGPSIAPSGGKLVFKQTTKVWEDNQWNGSTYLDNYILRVQWVDSTGTTHTNYYTIASTTNPDSITTTEDAASPLAGTAINATLADANNTQITVQIIQDQITSSTVLGPQGQAFTPSYNDKNTIWVGSDPSGTIPLDDYSYVHFNESPEIDTTANNWSASTNALKMRLHISEPFSWGDIIDVYTTPVVADKLEYKHQREVFTLAAADITIRFV